MPASLLIVDDEKHTREGLMAAFEELYDVYLARDADEALLLGRAGESEVEPLQETGLPVPLDFQADVVRLRAVEQTNIAAVEFAGYVHVV